MPISLYMPAFSPTMEEGVIANWLIKEGDSVEIGDVIAEIETDKATMELEATEEGILAKILVPAGDDPVAVNSIIALLAQEGEAIEGIHVPSTVEPSDTGASVEAVPTSALKDMSERPNVSPAGGRIFVSPLARRIAASEGIDLTLVQGTGPKGRIIRDDINRVQKPKPPIVEIASPAPKTDANVDTSIYPEGSYEIVEFDTMRKTIARRLTESKQTIPHFYLRADVELDALLDFRSKINLSAPKFEDVSTYKISVNDLVIKALALALRDNPDANVTWANGRILKHNTVDVSVAVAIPGGLITPIVRDAASLSISSISRKMKDLASRARERALSPEEFLGGTTSVSNLGMFGVSSFDAVINPPQATILAIGAGEKRPAARENELVIATCMTVTLSADHRMVDGALGANLLASFKSYIQEPLSLLA